MPVKELPLGASIAAPRGSVAICIPLGYGGGDSASCTLRSIAAHTPREPPILLWDALPRPAGTRELGVLEEAAGDREVLHARLDPAEGASADPFGLAAQSDLVLLRPGCQVAEGWLEGLRRAAQLDGAVATASALPSPAAELDQAAATVSAQSLRVFPRLAVPRPHCVYVRRSAVELVGGFDPVREDERDAFAARCSRVGLSHLLADDVLVTAADGAAPPAGAEAGQPSLERALSRVRRSLRRLSVLVDARILSRSMTGTEVQLLELLGALARSEWADIAAVVPDEPAPYAARALARIQGLTTVGYGDAHRALGDRADVVHRPYQVGDAGDLAFLASLGGRLVVTHLDLIAYHNASYFADAQQWQAHRELTRLALAQADHVVFGSTRVRDDALKEELLEPARATVVPLGVDHSLTDEVAAPAPDAAPGAAMALPPDAQALLCIGTDYLHKNRTFAVRVLEQLRGRHQWDGYLLMAGSTMRHGSSAEEESRLLDARPELGERVIDLGPVSEAERAWLLARARLVLYPTIQEGFGLVPFEAARHGVPCMWAPGTALAEVLPDTAGTIVPWDPVQTAERALELIRDEETRRRLLDKVASSAAGLTWDVAAARLLDLYARVCDAPAAPAAILARSHGVRPVRLGEDALRLVGPGGSLSADLHRPLLALAHSPLGRPALAAIKAGYRVSYRLRRAHRRR